jgi:hypothetical protein
MTYDEMIAVLQAAKDGKKIQLRRKDEPGLNAQWADAQRPIWDFFQFDYRVKLEPRTVWVNEYDGRLGSGVHETKAYADHSAFNVTHKAIQFVEVV